MSRSIFLTTNEIPKTTDLRYRLTTNRSNEPVPIVVQTSAIKTTNTAITRNNPRLKRNLKDKRRATGVRPDDILTASASTEGSANEDEEEESIHTIEPNESFEHNRTIPSTKSTFTVNRVQSSFENLTIPRADVHIKPSSPKIFRPEEFRFCRVEKQIPDDDSSILKYRQLEERIHTLESILYDKDNTIHDLQYKLDNITQNLADAEQQIYKLHQDKLTLIKAFTTIQDTIPSSDLPIRSNFITRN